MSEVLREQARGLFEAAQNILITAHIRPDGDAIGSVLGLGLALESVGKQVQMVMADNVPASFEHLPGVQQIQSRPQGKADLVVVLDSSDLKRLGDVVSVEVPPDLNIDHHVTNLHFARVNIVDTDAVATAAILAECLPLWGLPVDRPVAEVLLTGILTDTLGFRTSNMSAAALRIAADLVDLGADLPGLYHQALVQRSFEAARYWGAGLARLQRQDRLAWTRLSDADRHEAGYGGRNDADLINFLTTIKDIDVVVVFIEQPGGRVKVSWRARAGLDVARLALSFGGGGHPSAAGAELPGDLDSVQATVLNATERLLTGQMEHQQR